VLQMPFAAVQLRLRPARLDGLQHAAVGVADDALGMARQRAEESAPVGGLGACERLGEPEPRLAGAIADAAEDVEGDLAGGDSPPAGVQGSNPKGQMVEQQRAVCRPGRRTVGIEDDRRKDLHPIGEKLAVIGLAQLAGLDVDAKASGPITGHARGAHVAAAGTHRLQRLGDSPGHELVVARRLRALASLKPSLTVLAGAMPRLLPWQELREHVRLSAPARRALVALSAMTQLAVGAVQSDP